MREEFRTTSTNEYLTLTSFETNISFIEDQLADSNPSPYEMWQKIIFSLFMFPIILLSIVGNVLVVIAIVKYQYLKITNNMFLASLAIADCAVGILAMTPNAIQLLTGKWYLKSFACKFWLSCDVLFSTASILHLCCVSIDRYLSISDAYAFNYASEHPTKSLRVRFMIGFVWATSALLSFVPIFTNLYTTSEQAKIIDNLDYQDGQCQFIVNLSYRIVSSLVSFWLPGITMVIVYTRVMKKAYHLETHEFKINRSIYQSNSMNNDHSRHNSNLSEFNFNIKASTNLTNSDRKPNARRDTMVKHWKREYKALKTLGTVITVFCLCWVFFFLRYTLCDPIYKLCPEIIANNVLLEDVLFWIGYFNSMINPFLYNFTNLDFRRAFKHLLHLKTNTNRSFYQSNAHQNNNSNLHPNITRKKSSSVSSTQKYVKCCFCCLCRSKRESPTTSRSASLGSQYSALHKINNENENRQN